MDSIPSLPFIFAILLCIGGLLVGALHVRAAFSRRRSNRLAAQIGSILTATRIGLATIEARFYQIWGDHPEQSATPICQLETMLQDANLALGQCTQTFERLRNAPAWPRSYPGRWIAALVWTHPQACHQRERELKSLEQQVSALLASLATIRRKIGPTEQGVAGLIRRIEATLCAAGQARQAAIDLYYPANPKSALVAQAIADLDATTETIRSLQAQLSIPRHGNAGQDSLKPVLQQLATCQETVHLARQQIDRWQAALLNLQRLTAQIEIRLQEAKAALDNLPAQFSKGQLQTFWSELAARAETILDQRRTPAVENLADLCVAAEQLLTELETLARDCMLLREQQQHIAQMIATARHRSVQIQKQMESVSQTGACPVVWQRSETEMTQIANRLAFIADRLTAVDSLDSEECLATVLSVDASLRELEGRVNTVVHHHSRLMVALDSPELAKHETWIARASAIQGAVAGYAPDNWARQDAVLSLKSDIAMLAGLQKELAQLYLRQPIHEDQISLWLDRISTYIREQRALQTRLDRIDETLKALVETEHKAKQLTAGVLKLLARLPADIPTSSAPARAELRAIADLWQQGQRIADDLDESLVGRMADKGSAAHAWAQDCHDSARRLLCALETEMRATQDQLRQHVARIVRLAPLDMEPSMLIANKLAQTALQVTSETDWRPANEKDSLPGVMESLIDQIAAVTAIQARLSRALSELDRQIVIPLGNRLEEVLAQQRAAHEQWEALEQTKSRLAAWHPIPVRCPGLDEIARALTLAENSRVELAQRGRAVQDVIARLDDLIRQYRAISAQAGELRIHIEKQMTQLQLAWDRFALWRRQLRRYREQHLSDREMATAIHERLDEMERSVADLRRRFADASLSINDACNRIDQIVRAAYRDLEIRRSGRIQIVPASVIAPAQTQPAIAPENLQRAQ